MKKFKAVLMAFAAVMSAAMLFTGCANTDVSALKDSVVAGKIEKISDKSVTVKLGELSEMGGGDKDASGFTVIPPDASGAPMMPGNAQDSPKPSMPQDIIVEPSGSPDSDNSGLHLTDPDEGDDDEMLPGAGFGDPGAGFGGPSTGFPGELYTFTEGKDNAVTLAIADDAEITSDEGNTELAVGDVVEISVNSDGKAQSIKKVLVFGGEMPDDIKNGDPSGKPEKPSPDVKAPETPTQAPTDAQKTPFSTPDAIISGAPVIDRPAG